MTSLEIRILGVVGLVLAFIVALAVVAAATALVSLVGRAWRHASARRVATPLPSPGAERPVPRLKEAA
jgi:hypothetical protein